MSSRPASLDVLLSDSRWLHALARGLVQRRALAFARTEGILGGLVDDVAARRLDPRAAADALVTAIYKYHHQP